MRKTAAAASGGIGTGSNGGDSGGTAPPPASQNQTPAVSLPSSTPPAPVITASRQRRSC
jgi:hypothetical protein